MGNQRVCGKTIDDYCFYSGKNPELKLSEAQKVNIVRKRMQELDKKDWQRWVPLLGFYRTVKDVVTQDCLLLSEMYPTFYNVLAIGFGSSTTILGGWLLLDYLLR